MRSNEKKAGPGRTLLALAALALLTAGDQISKYYVLKLLRPVGAVTLIPGLLELSYLENTGVAFGLLRGSGWIVALFTLAACGVIAVVWFRYPRHTLFSRIASVLILAGGVGNMIDRVMNRFVVDFIHVMFFPYIFNVADCCVTVGAVLAILHVLLSSSGERKAKQEKNETETGQPIEEAPGEKEDPGKAREPEAPDLQDEPEETEEDPL